MAQEFALRLPLNLISELLDIPEGRRDAIHHWTIWALERGDDWSAEKVQETYSKSTEIFLELIAERHR